MRCCARADTRIVNAWIQCGADFDVQILLTNDDGIYAPGLAAMERELARLGDVTRRRAGDRAERRRPLDHVSQPADGEGSVRRRAAARLGGRGQPGRLREAGDWPSSARGGPIWSSAASTAA